MRIVLIGRGKMGTLIRETAAAAGDEIEAAFGRDDLDQLGKLGKAADVVMDFSVPPPCRRSPPTSAGPGRRCSPAPPGTRRQRRSVSSPWVRRCRCCGAPTTPWG